MVALILNGKCCFCRLNFFPNLCKMHQAFRLDLVTVRAPLVKQKRTLCYVWYLAAIICGCSCSTTSGPAARTRASDWRSRAWPGFPLRSWTTPRSSCLKPRCRFCAEAATAGSTVLRSLSLLLLFFTIWNVPCFFSCVTVIVKKDELGSIGPKQIVRWL